jgi:uncharacterized protein (TIGR01777 family)
MKTHNNLLITGGTGFIGRHLSEHLVDQGYRVTILTREATTDRSNSDHISYVSSLESLPDVNWYGVINLAGEPLDKSRWSEEQKSRIINSRVSMTARLNVWIRNLPTPPQVYISGSAIGWYGHWAEESLDEDSAFHEGFSHQLCDAWEREANKLADLGTRICTVRIGIVLGADGGSLPAMLLPAKMGLGGPMGSGDQWWSWVHIVDAVRCFEMLLDNPQAKGVFNMTAPRPERQGDFARTLGKQLRRPAILPLPSFMAKLMLGEFAEEVLLKGQRVLPKNLIAAGFTFKYPALSDALRNLV